MDTSRRPGEADRLTWARRYSLVPRRLPRRCLLPNTLLGDDGSWLAHADLGALGVGDRWADIAVAAMSTEWNYGPGWTDALVSACGVEPDRVRLAYYRDLWNAT